MKKRGTILLKMKYLKNETQIEKSLSRPQIFKSQQEVSKFIDIWRQIF